jgi:hypothetical protein
LATTNEHLTKARDNQSFAESLLNSTRPEREWGVIARFYSAVHYVEAYLSAHGKGTSTHTDRRVTIRRTAELSKIEGSFQQLYNQAWNARYLTLPRLLA